MGGIGAIRRRVLDGEERVAVLPRYFVAPDLAARRLVPLIRRVRPRSDAFRLVWKPGHPRAAELVALPRSSAASRCGNNGTYPFLFIFDGYVYPLPERFAIHKLFISRLRAGRGAKSDKDVRQACTLAAALAVSHPGALEAAVATVPPRARRHLRAGLAAARPFLEATAPRAWQELGQRDG